ncbi:peptidyl-prolyl cis-trans isomerase [Massilia sp. TS11]|uniref:peptidylprolyl isomerase n=1 Tax=Massilia sp. TS11 TaxID=2908003 RepID=UPI001EDAF6EA|nr:peptidyl-prolyl cis-trans isomerase [Massilia sp. TS11]MCG2584688.1 peptidylprolyl isomerase [Massilia sp. TS11]
MKFKPARLLFAMLAIAAAPAFAQAQAAAVTVNGKAIPQAKLDAAVKQVVASGRAPDNAQTRDAVKQELIAREVLLQEADKQGFGTKEDVKAAIDNARQSIIINAMLQAYVQKNPVKDEEIKAEYDKYKAAMGDKEYSARHILVKTEAEATDIIKQLKGGAKFEDLAKAKSLDGSKEAGGDLGWSSPARYVKAFSDAMVGLKKGQITETPVKSEFGFHVIKLDDVRDAQFPPLDQVKQQIGEQLVQAKVAKFRQDLMAKAKVK